MGQIVGYRAAGISVSGSAAVTGNGPMYPSARLTPRADDAYHGTDTHRGKEIFVTATKQLIRVGHSPDPDDAFMFHALANGKIDTGDYEFRHELVDIETLNRRAFAGELELTAVSIHAYAHLTDKYMLCPCGASMGDRYGPMVVAPSRLFDRRTARP